MKKHAEPPGASLTQPAPANPKNAGAPRLAQAEPVRLSELPFLQELGQAFHELTMATEALCQDATNTAAGLVAVARGRILKLLRDPATSRVVAFALDQRRRLEFSVDEGSDFGRALLDTCDGQAAESQADGAGDFPRPLGAPRTDPDGRPRGTALGEWYHERTRGMRHPRRPELLP